MRGGEERWRDVSEALNSEEGGVGFSAAAATRSHLAVNHAVAENLGTEETGVGSCG